MKKQYLVQVKLAFDPTKWWNAVWLTCGGSKRYVGTLNEAQNAINAVGHRFPGDPDQNVVESRIRVREVTEWEEVDA